MHITKAEIAEIVQYKMDDICKLLDVTLNKFGGDDKEDYKDGIIKELYKNANSDKSPFANNLLKRIVYDPEDPTVEVDKNLYEALKSHYNLRLQKLEELSERKE